MRVVNESSVRSAVIKFIFLVGALNICPAAAGSAAPVPMGLHNNYNYACARTRPLNSCPRAIVCNNANLYCGYAHERGKHMYRNI